MATSKSGGKIMKKPQNIVERPSRVALIDPDSTPASKELAALSLAPSTLVAFTELCNQLYGERDHVSFSVGEMLRTQSSDGQQNEGSWTWESYFKRKKQLEKAAELVNALRVALEKGPECSIDLAYDWARKHVVSSRPRIVKPGTYLTACKDYLFNEVERVLLEPLLKEEEKDKKQQQYRGTTTSSAGSPPMKSKKNNTLNDCEKK